MVTQLRLDVAAEAAAVAALRAMGNSFTHVIWLGYTEWRSPAVFVDEALREIANFCEGTRKGKDAQVQQFGPADARVTFPNGSYITVIEYRVSSSFLPGRQADILLADRRVSEESLRVARSCILLGDAPLEILY